MATEQKGNCILVVCIVVTRIPIPQVFPSSEIELAKEEDSRRRSRVPSFTGRVKWGDIIKWPIAMSFMVAHCQNM